MKKRSAIVAVILSMVCLLFGCGDTQISESNSENAFDNYDSFDHDESSTKQIAIESKVVNGPEDMQFEFDGDPLQFQYQFKSDGDCEMGLMIFVDGMIQPFKVQAETVSIYKEKIKANEPKQFNVSFVPIVGRAGEKVQVIFANIFNPKVIQLNNSVNTFGNNHNIFQPMPWSINLSKSVKTKDVVIKSQFNEGTFTEEALKSFVTTAPDGTQTNKLDMSMHFDYERSVTEKGAVVLLKKQKKLNLELYGNFPGSYRVTLIGDFKKQPINGCDYIDVNVKSGKKYTLTLDLAKSNFSKFKNVFAVAIPLDNDIGLLKTKSLYVEE